MVTHLAGPKVGSQDPKDPTTAELAQTKYTAVTLSRPITVLVYMLESISQVPMLKLCLPNGNFKLDLVKESLWAMIFGLQDFCCIVLLKNLELSLALIPNQ